MVKTSKLSNSPDHPKSLLDKLPAELRLMIYKEVIRQSDSLRRRPGTSSGGDYIRRPALMLAYPHLQHAMIELYEQKLLRIHTDYVTACRRPVLWYEARRSQYAKAGLETRNRHLRRSWRMAFAQVEVAAQVEKLVEKEIASLTAHAGDCRGWEAPSLICTAERRYMLWHRICVDGGYLDHSMREYV